jgi:hypothetical protein
VLDNIVYEIKIIWKRGFYYEKNRKNRSNKTG